VRINGIKQITEKPFLNLFETTYTDGGGKKRKWIYASRNSILSESPTTNAVVIIPTHISTDGTRRLVLISEFRVPIRGFELGFPAGLIEDSYTPEETAKIELHQETGLTVTKVIKTSPPVYSSAGMTDESTILVFVECTGTLSTDHLEETEQIKPMLVDFEGLKIVYHSDVNFGAKCWPIIDAIIDRGAI